MLTNYSDKGYGPLKCGNVTPSKQSKHMVKCLVTYIRSQLQPRPTARPSIIMAKKMD